MELAALLAEAGLQRFITETQDVTGIAYDSRRVQPGNLFVAIPGFHTDGARFVADAFARGAAVAVVDADAGGDLDGQHMDRVVLVQDSRAALSALAAAWYGFPARALRTVGVTGTDGKTTTSYMITAVLEGGGFSTGLFTTVAFKVRKVWEDNESRQTTPEALEVQALLRRMVDAGCDYGVLESTSHGLELHKLDHCDYDIAVFTNLSPDHLDFHQTVDRYRAAKGRLFAMLDTARPKGIDKLAVVNADAPDGRYMAEQTRARISTYGFAAGADIRIEDAQPGSDATRFLVRANGVSARVSLHAPGLFNVANAAAAIAVGVGQGITLPDCVAALEQWQGVPGRMQRVDRGQPFTVVVDYAHTGASFRKALEALRPSVRGRLITVFGCAGERGVERRSGMGGVAAELADYTVLTTEDPRGEDPDAIIADIGAAMRAAGAEEGTAFERVPDRREAIDRAFALARAGDLVLLAGKGHEHSIETATGRMPWDEAAVATELLG